MSRLRRGPQRTAERSRGGGGGTLTTVASTPQASWLCQRSSLMQHLSTDWTCTEQAEARAGRSQYYRRHPLPTVSTLHRSKVPAPPPQAQLSTTAGPAPTAHGLLAQHPGALALFLPPRPPPISSSIVLPVGARAVVPALSLGPLKSTPWSSSKYKSGPLYPRSTFFLFGSPPFRASVQARLAIPPLLTR